MYLITIAQANMLTSSASYPWLLDKVVLPRLVANPQTEAETSAFRLLYVDNYGGLACSEAHASSLRDGMVADLAAHGVKSTADDDSANTLIGFELDQNRYWKPTVGKLSRIVSCSLYLCLPNTYVSGEEIEIYVGHVVHYFSLKPEMLALISSLYRFIQVNYRTRTLLWKSCQKEAWFVYSLAPLAVADMQRAWSLLSAT